MTLALLIAAIASAGPAISIAPAQARPGDAVLIRVPGASPPSAGTLAGRPLFFWRGEGEWRALGPLPIETPPGTAIAELTVGGLSVEGSLSVIEPGFPTRNVELPERFVEEPVDPGIKARIARDRRAFDAALSQRPGPPLFLDGFAWPREPSMTGRFGDQRLLNGERRSVHYGLDLAGPRGTRISAAARGIVVLTRDAYYTGKTVMLWHGAEVYTVYSHLDRIVVQRGAKVRKGQRIGLLGSTGRSNGPHLDFRVRVSGLYVDPESLLSIDLARGTAPPRLSRGSAGAGE